MTRPEFQVEYGTDYPVLGEYVDCWDPVSLVMGPLGSGKTWGSLQKLELVQQRQAPNHDNCRRTRVFAIRNTYPELMSTTVKDFEEVTPSEWYRLRRGGLEPPTALVEYDLEDGTWVQSEIVFLALDRADAIRRLRGSQPTAFWWNEVKELSWEVVIMSRGRTGRFPPSAEGGATWHGCFGDYNAPDEDHWIAKLAANPPDGWRCFRQPGGVLKDGINPDGSTKWVPNPDAENLQNLPDGYYANQISVGKSLPQADSWIGVNLGNLYGLVVDGKPVHPAFNEAVHVLNSIDYVPGWPIYVGVDYGRTPAAAIAQLDENFNRLNVLAELVTEGMSAALFGPLLKDLLNRRFNESEVIGWGDPAGDAQGQATEDTPRDIMRGAGVPLDAAPSNVFALRVSAVDVLLTQSAMDGRPRLFVSRSGCPTIVRALGGGYQYKRLQVSGDAVYSDNPDKNKFSHVAEALHYLALGLGFGRELVRRKPKGRRPKRARMR